MESPIRKYYGVNALKNEVTLEEYLSKLNRGKGTWSKLRLVYEKTVKGELKLIDPNPPRTLAEYALRLDYSLWFWTLTALVLLAVIVVYASSTIPQLTTLRYFLGTLYVLYLPGYVLVEALYPDERDLKPLERLALSIGLSLAVVPLIGLILNYTPWGIRLDPVVASLAIYTLVISIVALVRKYSVYKSTMSQAGVNRGRRPS
jgi:Predicted membrane protein